jgi:hypothetical protein
MAMAPKTIFPIHGELYLHEPLTPVIRQLFDTFMPVMCGCSPRHHKFHNLKTILFLKPSIFDAVCHEPTPEPEVPS